MDRSLRTLFRHHRIRLESCRFVDVEPLAFVSNRTSSTDRSAGICHSGTYQPVAAQVALRHHRATCRFEPQPISRSRAGRVPVWVSNAEKCSASCECFLWANAAVHRAAANNGDFRTRAAGGSGGTDCYPTNSRTRHHFTIPRITFKPPTSVDPPYSLAKRRRVL